MPIYRVRVEYETVVLADDEHRAELTAIEASADDALGAGWPSVVRVVSGTADLPEGWDGNCIPWGEKSERSIEDILAGRPGKEVPDVQ